MTAWRPVPYVDRMLDWFSRGGLTSCLVVCVVGIGCGDDDRPGGMDAGRDATTADAGVDAPSGCMSEAECDDGFACTIDMCTVDRICRHTPLNERCEDGELCTLDRGCASGCVTGEDCDDGNFCDGVERCIAGDCFEALEPVDCDDGNACSIDSCDPEAGATGACSYDVSACDAGVPMGDGGMPPVDFDPDVHYEGRFVVAPAPSLGCPPASYSFSEVRMTIVGDELRITADRFTLIQNPRPTGNMFDASSTADANCNPVRLVGSFSDSNLLSATWTASCSGFCGNQTREIVGERR